tara:strand:- start:250 stop:540 length:291 start_codon:yes stop_codon:yes gene_type:complete
MAVGKRAKAVCDVCGFVYPHNVMKLNSYGLLVCPTDFDGAYDEKNHPQNRAPNVKDDETIRNPRPTRSEAFTTWDNQNTNWEATTQDWNIVSNLDA